MPVRESQAVSLAIGGDRIKRRWSKPVGSPNPKGPGYRKGTMPLLRRGMIIGPSPRSGGGPPPASGYQLLVTAPGRPRSQAEPWEREARLQEQSPSSPGNAPSAAQGHDYRPPTVRGRPEKSGYQLLVTAPEGISLSARMRNNLLQCLFDSSKYKGPIAPFLLAEQAHGRIPGRIWAFQHPAPVRSKSKQHPYRFSESTC